MVDKSQTGSKRALVIAGAAAAVAFVVAQILSVVCGKGPVDHAKALAAPVMAQWIDRDLEPELAAFGLELPPGPDGVPGKTTLGAYVSSGVLFVNFWFTHCEPCIEELPSMIALNRKLRGKPFKMLAVSYDEDWKAIETFFQKVMGRMPTEGELALARDPTTDVPSMLRTKLGTLKFPETYVIRDGRVLARFVNKRDWLARPMVEFFERLLDDR